MPAPALFGSSQRPGRACMRHCGVNGTFARACARNGRNSASTRLRYPGLAWELALQHVACGNQHWVAQQVWRVAAEVAQSFDDDRLYLGDAQAARAEEWRSQTVLQSTRPAM